MKKLQAVGLIAALVGVIYASYWSVTRHQAKQLENVPTEIATQELFVQTYPNLDRAFRFFNFRPYEDDYSGMSMHPGQFITRHMLRHIWIGIALLFLGIGIATFPAATTPRRIVHSVAILCLGASLVLIALYHPIVWFWY